VKHTIALGFGMVLAFAVPARPAGAQSLLPALTETAPEPAPAAAAGEPGEPKRFLRDVVGDYKHFVSVDSAVWLGVGGAGALAVHAADSALSESAQEGDPLTLPGGGVYGSQWLHIPVAMAWWVVAGVAGSERHAAAGRDLLRVQLSVVSWTYAVKLASDRTRPNGDPHSFPSGHASTSFATAMVLQQHYGWKAGLPAFAAAAYSAASRVADNQHWASDVVFGAALGMACGRTVTISLRNTQVTVAPLAVPGGGGVQITALRSP
jgi:membrane-associated phospholipid phosphatase